MLVVETIAKIRRAFFKQGKSIKAICRELGVSRKVVRKVIRSGATEFRYEREDQPLPKIGRWRDSLDQLLSENEAKPLRERLTLIRLFEELRGCGLRVAMMRCAATRSAGPRNADKRRLQPLGR
jgi:transposase-like protein